MDNDVLLLTIAIPTFNRHQLLEEQIKSIMPQIVNEVKVVVYDNCSFPPVMEIIGDLCAGKIQIFRNATNVGGDANICRCFENCDTEWLWVLSDDDIVKNNAINTILNTIKSNSDSVFINFKADSDYTTIGFEGFCRRKPNYGAAFSISICLYNNFKLKPYLFYYYSYLSSCHGQLIVVLKYLEDNDDICSFIKDDIILRYTPASWSKKEFIERLPIFLSAFNGQALDLVKIAFGAQIVFHLLLFLSILRRFYDLNRRTQFVLFARTMSFFKLQYLFTRRNRKVLVVFVISFFCKSAPSKIISILKMLHTLLHV